jgi:hypothetical protein
MWPPIVALQPIDTPGSVDLPGLIQVVSVNAQAHADKPNCSAVSMAGRQTREAAER